MSRKRIRYSGLVGFWAVAGALTGLLEPTAVEADRHGIVHVTDRSANRVALFGADLAPSGAVENVQAALAVGLYRDESTERPSSSPPLRPLGTFSAFPPRPLNECPSLRHTVHRVTASGPNMDKSWVPDPA
eukprot:1192600-Prorocentrum_minimum.AAC.3